MTKNISVSDDAYDSLSRLKRENESFSDVIRRIGKKAQKEDIMKFAGLWEGDKEIERIFKQIDKDRHAAKLREVKF